MKIAGYNLVVPNSASILLFIFVLLVLILLTIWAKYSSGLRKFIKEAHTNNTGRAGLKYIVASFFSFFIMGSITIRGLLYNVWPPETYVIAILSFIALCLGLGSWDLNSAYKSGIVITKKQDEQTAKD